MAATKKTTTNERASEDGETPKPKRRRVKVKRGQLVAVPLLDGTFALAHVAHHYIGVTVVQFDHRAKTPPQLLQGVDDALRARPLAVLAITSIDIADGNWPVIGEREPQYPPELLDTKGHSSTSPATSWLFDAYYGLRPWDGMHDPRYYEKELLPGVPVPSTVRYKKDFERDAQAAAAETTSTTPPAEETAPPITEGPGVIHIEIKYEGDGLPSMELLHRRKAIEDGLEAAGVGEVTDAGGGGGVMDIYLETKDVAHAMPFVHPAIKAAGFDKDARIEVQPMSDGDNDDSEEQDDH